MKNLTRIALIALVSCLALGAQAQDKPCSKSDAQKAQKALDHVASWPQLHKAFRDFGHCDSGDLDDAFTDTMLRLMVEWRDVEGLAGPMAKDPQYKAFIERHLLSPMAKPDHPSVYSRAKASCPPGLDAFCAEIAALVKPL